MPGKKVRGAHYVHVSAVDLLPGETRGRIEAAAALVGPHWNVAKIEPASVSLLVYEDFDAVAFPRLLRAWRVDGAGEPRFLDYSTRENPPVLHRKELLLRPDDPRRRAFAELTRDAEARGLLADAHRIGTVVQWEERLRSRGVEVVGHRLADAAVARHRTAIGRNRLSAPVQHLVVHGLVGDGLSFFDYGCGQGDDLRVLREAGIDASGWDPHYAPAEPRREADAVNLGFVLNVIEDPTERRETLLKAWTLARRVLSVAVMVVGQAPTDTLEPYGDGFLTSRGTFQKYFAQPELRSLVASVTGAEPVVVAPGIVLAFRAPEDAQDFLFRRQSRTRALPDWLPQAAAPRAVREQTARAEAASLVEAVGCTWLAFGRRPAPDELPPSTRAAIRDGRAPLKHVLDWAEEDLGTERREAAAVVRREELTLAFAMRCFGETTRASLSPRLRRDARHFFGTQADADRCGRDFLFSLGRTGEVEAALAKAVDHGLAHRVGLKFHFLGRRLVEMPLVVRGFVACVEVVAGDLDEVDVLVIDPEKRTASLLKFVEFSGKLPLVIRATKVFLARHDLSDRRFEAGSRLLFLHRSAYADAPDERSERESLEARMRSALGLASDSLFCGERDLADAIRAGRKTGGATT